ncbi:MAG: DUF1326 domain-containing protein [Candidatus Rokuibacteriota bacterium]
MTDAWRLAGDFAVSCNCDVFCPCVLSLGHARPTQGVCYSWFGYHAREGQIGAVAVAGGLNAVMMLEVPGRMEEGNWTAALYLDERATAAQRSALAAVLSGQRGGPIGWVSLMLSRLVESRVVAIRYTAGERECRFEIPTILDGTVEAEPGLGGDGLVRITNARYWMSPDVVIARGKKSRFRDHGRNWNLTGKSAELGRFDWTGP